MFKYSENANRCQRILAPCRNMCWYSGICLAGLPPHLFFPRRRLEGCIISDLAAVLCRLLATWNGKKMLQMSPVQLCKAAWKSMKTMAIIGFEKGKIHRVSQRASWSIGKHFHEKTTDYKTTCYLSQQSNRCWCGVLLLPSNHKPWRSNNWPFTLQSKEEECQLIWHRLQYSVG